MYNMRIYIYTHMRVEVPWPKLSTSYTHTFAVSGLMVSGVDPKPGFKDWGLQLGV